ncbi:MULTISPECIES: GNAT family N-acetyltransferase [Burkholderia]|uniref:GNAT family N-acetyltransferase n=1 Tax=Burkholderia TaxID=32008 RepID=UPI00075E9990|nr:MULTISPECIES: GNAT family N-acetyltransferase [Burkholderia]KVM70890.1 hypothetical protein WJ59_07050 [Burkholderia gladioli]
MAIRRAGLEDASRIASIHVDSWRHTYRGIIPADYLDRITHEARLRHWSQALTADDPAVFVHVNDAGETDAWAAAGHDRAAPDDTSTLELQAIYVDPARVRTGIGRRLIEHVLATCAAPGIARLVVWVLERNEPALRFYHRIGFDRAPIQSITVERGGASLGELKLEMRLDRRGVDLPLR